jgi:hypothetical protein
MRKIIFATGLLAGVSSHTMAMSDDEFHAKYNIPADTNI